MSTVLIVRSINLPIARSEFKGIRRTFAHQNTLNLGRILEK